MELTAPPSYDVQVYGDLREISPRNRVVVLWYPYTQGEEEMLLALVDEFNVRNEWGITILAEYGGSQDAIHERVRAQIGSGVLPQIVTATRHQVATYVAQGAAVALEPYMESRRWGHTWEELDDFYPAALAVGAFPQLDGQYGWPLLVSVDVLVYNEQWLAEVGHTEPPKTWDEFRAMACAASDPETLTYGYEFSADAATFAAMLANRGGPMVDDSGAAYAFDGQEGAETLGFVSELLDQNCATLQAMRHGDRADFGAGVVLFAIASSAELPYYGDAVADGAGFKWSVAALPTSLDGPAMTAHGQNLVILQATPQQQLAAWLFLKWLTEAEQQARWVHASGTLPVRASAVDLLQDYRVDHPQYEAAIALLSHDAVVEPGVVGYDRCQGAIADMLLAVAGGEDPEAHLAEARAACDAALETAGQQ